MGVIAAQSFAAFGTLTLAYFAFKAIRQTRETQKKLRTEGQLREVTEWAVDVIKAPSKHEIPTLSPDIVGFEDVSKRRYTENVWESFHGNIARELELVEIRGEYIRCVAERIDKDLHSKVEGTIGRIISLKVDIMKGGYAEVKKELRQALIESTKQVIERASGLMASL